MVLFCMYIFNRHGACLFYEEWRRSYHAQATREDDKLLMFGLLFSLREMTIRLLPAATPHAATTKSPLASPASEGAREGMRVNHNSRAQDVAWTSGGLPVLQDRCPEGSRG
jgi:hypothetical protein